MCPVRESSAGTPGDAGINASRVRLDAFPQGRDRGPVTESSRSGRRNACCSSSISRRKRSSATSSRSRTRSFASSSASRATRPSSSSTRAKWRSAPFSVRAGARQHHDFTAGAVVQRTVLQRARARLPRLRTGEPGNSPCASAVRRHACGMAPANCERCRATIRMDHWRFCPDCGACLVTTPRMPGVRVQPGRSTYCWQCGHLGHSGRCGRDRQAEVPPARP